MHVAETREEARKNVEFGLENFSNYFKDISTFPIIPREFDNAYEYLTENRIALIGPPDDAIEYIETSLRARAALAAWCN